MRGVSAQAQAEVLGRLETVLAGGADPAALFAAVHSGVWPTPVPLFFLGMGLGYLVARSGSIVPAVVVHGLFNFVSAVLVLRGDPAG